MRRLQELNDNNAYFVINDHVTDNDNVCDVAVVNNNLPYFSTVANVYFHQCNGKITLFLITELKIYHLIISLILFFGTSNFFCNIKISHYLS